ncbi:SdpI family protein [Corynebacterium sp. 320]|uniref:SdpI family protein n=1 Tax=Corynebacterium TaxID=1716 RepID=UPI00125CC5C6|nr:MULTISPECIES: SdpI family protein [Corynebacterium]KAB1502827.1 SdpI family protein [Corynebacterium sp. 320]KAB1550432.1 SdpI family protein [Corynebacterium sp. 319]KAB1554837.1 SdpI family protein [Corynebacterium sp. 321]KAB3526490.1 SdpI family protein [Corynebacterium sp. 250]KAB3539809.1 SdpI family protein [Corynebacterium sp. 366]
MIVLTVILAVLGVAILAIGAAGIAGILPGNSVIGLRIPEVRKSKEMWVMGHKIAGPAWAGAGLALLGAALVSLRASGFLWLIIAMLVIGALVLLGMGAGMAAHALAQIDARRKAAEASAEGGCCSEDGGCGCGSADGDAGACGTGEADGAGAGAAGAAAQHGCSSTGQPTAAECASGNACGSCSLNGACEGGGAAFDTAGTARVSTATPDVAAARQAAAVQDQR